jgi:hypothetical protein
VAAEGVSKAEEDGAEGDEAEEDAKDGGGAEGQLVVLASEHVVIMEVAGIAHGSLEERRGCGEELEVLPE